MQFEQRLAVNRDLVLSSLGYSPPVQPDEATAQATQKAVEELEAAATPRWCAHRAGLAAGIAGEPVFGGLALPGKDLAAHLKGCSRAILFAVTLGASTDSLLRTATATDMHRAVILDAVASALVEQYAALAEKVLRAQEWRENGMYTTGRFSPGYGDAPLTLQPQLIRMLDAPRSIGLSASESGILLPRKSVTAFIGAAAQPVRGQLAGCENCALNGKCSRDKPCAR